MMPSEKLEDVIRNIRPTTGPATDRRIISAVKTAMAKRNERSTAPENASGLKRRIIMSSNWTKLVTAAAIVAVVAVGMHALTGSIDGTSVTLAQVKQAMQTIDWMKIINRGGDENQNPSDPKIELFSFESNVHVTTFKGTIRYRDFKTGKALSWAPGDTTITESTISQSETFAYGAAGPFEMIDNTLRLTQAENDANITRELGTYHGNKVEVWKSKWDMKNQRGASRTLTIYIDPTKRLPIAATFEHGRPDGNVTESNIEFEYPQTGPADIYQAGAPASLQIKKASVQSNKASGQ